MPQGAKWGNKNSNNNDNNHPAFPFLASVMLASLAEIGEVCGYCELTDGWLQLTDTNPSIRIVMW